MEKLHGFKDFEQVSLKATYQMEINGKIIEENETIAYFDRIQIAGLDGLYKVVTANGGFDNRAHVYWETLKEAQLAFTQGVFSKTQFALMLNSKIIKREENEVIYITYREELESDEQGVITCKYTPVKDIFVYDQTTGEKLSFTRIDNQLTISTPFTNVIVVYIFAYKNGGSTVKVGQTLLSGFISLEGKTRLKDDTTGQVVTGIIRIPKLKIMSDLSMRLGEKASPIVGNFQGVALPVGSRSSSYIVEWDFLYDDINSDL